jgi:hypothetical protein
MTRSWPSTKAFEADRRAVAEHDGVLASMAVKLRLAIQNEARTHCYHFATQLGRTRRYGPEQGGAFERNPLDNSILAVTEQNAK